MLDSTLSFASLLPSPLPAGGIGLSNTNVQAIRALPPQQKLLVCTAGKLLGEERSAAARVSPAAVLCCQGSEGAARARLERVDADVLPVALDWWHLQCWCWRSA